MSRLKLKAIFIGVNSFSSFKSHSCVCVWETVMSIKLNIYFYGAFQKGEEIFMCNVCLWAINMNTWCVVYAEGLTFIDIMWGFFIFNFHVSVQVNIYASAVYIKYCHWYVCWAIHWWSVYAWHGEKWFVDCAPNNPHTHRWLINY